MAGITFHPAVGIGALMPGWYDIPQNPITMAQQGIRKTPGVGDILATAGYSVPSNPVMAFTGNAVKPLGQGGGVGCACGGGGGACGCHGGSVNGISGFSKELLVSGGMGDIPGDFSAIFSRLTSGDIAGAGGSLMALLQEPVAMLGGLPLWAAAIAGYFAVTTVMGHEVTVGRRRRA